MHGQQLEARETSRLGADGPLVPCFLYLGVQKQPALSQHSLEGASDFTGV